MKRVLITGASGFIGSFLVQEALRQGYEVYAGVRTTSSRKFLTDARINFIELGLSRKELIKEKLIYYAKKIGRFDFVIHNAGLTKSLKKEDFDRVNFEYTKNLVEALIESQNVPEKFIFMSSLAALGPGDSKSLKPIQNSDHPKPISNYGKSKLKSEQFIKSLNNFPYLIFRPTGVYGPREKDYFLMYKSIKKHLELYVGSPHQNLSFVYVMDLVRLVVSSLDIAIKGKSYLVSDGNDYTAKEFSEILKSILRVNTIQLTFPISMVAFISRISEKALSVFGKVPTLNTDKFNELTAYNWLCDSGEVYADLKLKPAYNLYSGLTQTISWYQQQKML